ncbi:MAG: rod shape-determining protein MreD [Candidatus Latescibacterota bacterium]
MRMARNVLLLVAVFVLQTTWVQVVEVAGMAPDLVMLVLVAIALGRGVVEATLLGFGVGFLQDVHMPDDLGLNALANSLVGFGAGYCRTRVEADSLPVQVALVVGAVAARDLVFYVGSSAISLPAAPLLWLRYSVGRALYTGAVTALLAAGLTTWRRRFAL